MARSLELITLEQIVALFPGHVYWKDAHGVYQGCNDEQAQYLGFQSGQQVIGKTDFDFMLMQGAEGVREGDLRVMHSNQGYTFEESVILRDGSEATFLSKKVPYHDSEGNVIGVAGISFNITDRKQHERAVFLAKEAAEAANLVKSNFLATVSHELRTPLNGIIGAAQLFARESLSVVQREYLNDMYQSAISMLRLVDDVLDFTKLELGTLKLEVTTFSIRSIVASVINSITFQRLSEHVVIESEIDPAVPQQMWGDALRFKQILLNLLGNANKFTDRGSIKVKVFGVAQQNNMYNLQVVIEDTGIGMPAEMLDKIFDRFIQIEGSYSRRYPGAGLGLSICKQLLELMGGTISVGSELGYGSVFRFQLPLQIVEVEQEPQSLPLEVPIFVNAEEKKFQAQVLLVEDIPLNCKVASYMLEDLGCKVDVAENGASAIRMVEQNRYDIIFMDVGLPDKSGLVVTREIREKYLSDEFPIIAMTAHAMEKDIQNCLEAGMNHVLTKPILQSEIFEILDKWLPKCHK